MSELPTKIDRKEGYLYIVFDGGPGPNGCTFVEVEDSAAAGVRFGEWQRIYTDDETVKDYWALGFKDPRDSWLEIEGLKAQISALKARNAELTENIVGAVAEIEGGDLGAALFVLDPTGEHSNE